MAKTDTQEAPTKTETKDEKPDSRSASAGKIAKKLFGTATQTIPAFETVLKEKGFREIDPSKSDRRERRVPLARPEAFGNQVAVVFTNYDVHLHESLEKTELDSGSRKGVTKYFVKSKTETPELFWDRLDAQRMELYGGAMWRQTPDGTQWGVKQKDGSIKWGEPGGNKPKTEEQIAKAKAKADAKAKAEKEAAEAKAKGGDKGK